MKKKAMINIILISAVVLIILLPVFINKDKTFSGTDEMAKDMVAQSDPGYKVWFSNIWNPPSKEIENLMFMLQAVIGAGIVGFIIGYYAGKNRK